MGHHKLGLMHRKDSQLNCMMISGSFLFVYFLRNTRLMFASPMHYYSYLELQVVLVSIGYFVYDSVDMAINDTYYFIMWMLGSSCFIVINGGLFLRILHSDGFLCSRLSSEQLGGLAEDSEYKVADEKRLFIPDTCVSRASGCPRSYRREGGAGEAVIAPESRPEHLGVASMEQA
ncbi:hypothetical protein ANCDUO_13363 [Ancylostoma duodenale]|uniref:Uncharacterized protein n=1 Tax=Ancylostoma duodenale TaxID=51022 RepID=A0A0C2GHB0_9BILA|nr:hypothetical protein ANCDUO_13363 [Ancylostoma duodenale]